MDEKLMRACEAACVLFEESSEELIQWAVESRNGGWSTHQVERNTQMSLRLSSEASRLRCLLRKANDEPTYLHSISAGVPDFEFPQTRIN